MQGVSKGMQLSKYHAGEAPSESFFVFFCSIPINATPNPVGDSMPWACPTLPFFQRVSTLRLLVSKLETYQQIDL